MKGKSMILNCLDDEQLLKKHDELCPRFDENAKEYYEILEDETRIEAELITRGYRDFGGIWRKKEMKNE